MAFITITFGTGRNIRHEKMVFDSYEEAKAFVAAHLENDDNVSRVTIYDPTEFAYGYDF